MATLTLPFNPQPGGDEDVTQVMANFNALVALVNGNLEASTNISVGTPAALTGASSDAGTSASLARSDHTHIVRGTEELTADPTTGNFIGREYMNTSSLKKRLCINAAGSGTWVTSGNYDTSDMPLHAANHSQGGSDALASNAISAAMMGRALAATATMSADTFLGNGAWADLITPINVTATGTQLCAFSGLVLLENTESGGPNLRNCSLRLFDNTSSTEVWATGTYKVAATDASPAYTMMPVNVAGWFSLTTGLHALKLQGMTSAANKVKADKNFTDQAAASHTATILNFMLG